jgi:hypothetical protein
MAAPYAAARIRSLPAIALNSPNDKYGETLLPIILKLCHFVG